MRIKNLKIKRFGPLKSLDLKLSEGLNVIFGDNETGKTTLAQLIIKEIFRHPKGKGLKKLTEFEGVERYRDQDFEGEMILEHDGREYSLPEDRKKLDLESHFGGIPLSRLICIESGDLSIPKEGPFFESVKEKLSGLKGGIEKIRSEIFSRAGLPASGESSKTSLFYKEFSDLETRLATLRLLPDPAKIREIEASLADVRARLKDMEEKRLANASSDFLEYENLKDKAKGLENYTDETFKRLSNLKQSKEKFKIQKESLEKAYDDLSKRLIDDESMLEEKKAKFKEASLKLSLRSTIEFEEDAQKYIVKRNFWEPLMIYILPSYIGWIISFAITAITLAIMLFSSKTAYYIPGIFMFLGIILFLVWKNLNLKKEEIKGLLKRIARQNEELDLPIAEDISHITFSGLADLRSGHKKQEGEIAAQEEAVKDLKAQMAKIAKGVKENEEGMEMYIKRIGEIFKETSVQSIDEYEERLKESRELDSQILRKREALEKLLGPDEKKWEDKIKDIKNSGPVEKYDPSLLSELSSKEERLSKELGNLKKPFLMEGFENPSEVILKTDAIEKELAERTKTLEAAKICERLLSEIDEERNSALLKSFEEKESPIYKFLEKILGRKIKEIFFEEGNLSIDAGQNKRFTLEELSRGTADQVLFSFRLSVIKDAFKEPHFLMLDDAFLTSDYTRRSKLVDILADFASQGWQVIYMTFDIHTKDLLKRSKALVIDI